MEEGHGRLGSEAAGPSVLVLFPSRATLGIPIIPFRRVCVNVYVNRLHVACRKVCRYLAAAAAGRGDTLEGDDRAGRGFRLQPRRLHYMYLLCCFAETS
jgi:hypothetical protein